MATRIEVIPSAARTATFQTATFGSNFRNMQFGLEVTAASGTTPTLNIDVEHSVDGTVWHVVGSFVEVTSAPDFEFLPQTAEADLWRLNCTIAGTTPSFTFVVRVLLFD